MNDAIDTLVHHIAHCGTDEPTRDMTEIRTALEAFAEAIRLKCPVAIRHPYALRSTCSTREAVAEIIAGERSRWEGVAEHKPMTDLAAEIRTRDVTIAELRARLDKLRAFCIEAMEESDILEGLQDLAVEHGLLKKVVATEPCFPDEEGCKCNDYGFPTECYRTTALLRGVAE